MFCDAVDGDMFTILVIAATAHATGAIGRLDARIIAKHCKKGLQEGFASQFLHV